jgi:hypothetical protein
MSRMETEIQPILAFRVRGHSVVRHSARAWGASGARPPKMTVPARVSAAGRHAECARPRSGRARSGEVVRPCTAEHNGSGLTRLPANARPHCLAGGQCLASTSGASLCNS